MNNSCAANKKTEEQWLRFMRLPISTFNNSVALSSKLVPAAAAGLVLIKKSNADLVRRRPAGDKWRTKQTMGFSASPA
jgi:hypothetical protein